MRDEKITLSLCHSVILSGVRVFEAYSLDMIGVNHFPKVELPRRDNSPAHAGGTDVTPSFFRWPGFISDNVFCISLKRWTFSLVLQKSLW